MIRLGSPRIDRREIDAVEDLLRSGTLSTGEVVEAFETDVADLAGREHAAAVCSGGVALEMAFEASGVSPGTGVLVSPFNCGAVLDALLRANVVPVFADVDPETYGLDPAAAERAIEAASVPVEGVLAVHLYGQPCDAVELERLAERHDLVLVEDFAQAPGAVHRDRPAGSFGDVGVVSFGATKNLTTAEGGAIVADDVSVVEAVRALRSGECTDGDAVPRSVRMNDLEAAIGRAQIEKYDEILRAKQSAASKYDEELPDAVQAPTAASDRTHVYHGYPIRTGRRDELSAFLAERDIQSAAVYDALLSEYPRAASRTEAPTGNLVEARRAADEVLLIPVHGSITDAEARRVAAAVSAFFP